MRGIGYLFGIWLLANAIPTIFNPHYWLHWTERNLSDVLPASVTKTSADFFRLPDNALRWWALQQIIVGMVLLFMASMLPSRYIAFRGRMPMWRRPWGMGMGMGMKHPGMGMGYRGVTHTHEHTHEEEEGEGEESL